MDRKEHFDWLLDGHHDATLKAHAARSMLKKAKRERMSVFTGKPHDIAAAEADCVTAENEIAEIAAELWQLANQPSPPAPINTVPGLLATVDEYAQAHVALSQTRTPHTRAKASQRAETLRLAIKMAVEG